MSWGCPQLASLARSPALPAPLWHLPRLAPLPTTTEALCGEGRAPDSPTGTPEHLNLVGPHLGSSLLSATLLGEWGWGTGHLGGTPAHWWRDGLDKGCWVPRAGTGGMLCARGTPGTQVTSCLSLVPPPGNLRALSPLLQNQPLLPPALPALGLLLGPGQGSLLGTASPLAGLLQSLQVGCWDRYMRGQEGWSGPGTLGGTCGGGGARRC